MKICIVIILIAITSACASSRQAVRHSSVKAAMLPDEIHYRFDSDAVLAKYQSVLNTVAEYLNNHPDRLIVVEGHTDKIGTKDYNMDLGDRRALNAKALLVKQGVAEDRIISVTFGEDQQAYPKARQNRRVILRDAALKERAGDR
ncbi:MAG: OmpA family protein [Deltaproteobacteria bacterium]|nr:OmpA family protein [Deltaproteobacteria bacterium]